MKLKELFSTINPYEKKLFKPYIIAEAGVNHEGCMKIAKRLCDEAKEGGADAIKFQTYKANTIASKAFNIPSSFNISSEPKITAGRLRTRSSSFSEDMLVLPYASCCFFAIIIYLPY